MQLKERQRKVKTGIDTKNQKEKRSECTNVQIDSTRIIPFH